MRPSSDWRRCRAAASTAARRALLSELVARATEPERQLLWGVLGGELRHGALDGVMVDAVAKAAGVPIAAVRRAHMMSGSLGATATAALTGGAAALGTVGDGAGAGRPADARRAGTRPRRPP